MARELAKTCGAMGRKGRPCRRPAGWGTNHVGFGACKLHLGATGAHTKAAARAEALQFVRGQLGQEITIDPLDGVLLAVRLGYGVVDYWRHRLAEPDVDQAMFHEQYQKALMDYTRICEIAVKAGVADKQIKIVERASEQLSLIAEEALAALQLDISVEARARYVKAYAGGLARLEQAVESTAVDVAA